MPQDHASPPAPAPYVPFRTFLAALDSFQRALPSQIDRSLWPSYSGAIRGQLLAAFRFLGLIDDGHCPTAPLREMAARPETRRPALRAAIEQHYQPLMALELTRSSPRQFEEAVRSLYGLGVATHRKAVSFFLQAAQYAGIPLSPLLKAKTRSAAFGHRRPPAPAAGTAEPASSVSKSVELKSGGAVTLTASLDLFSLSAEDRAFVFDLIDRLQQYERS
jgi:hypothetical protein